MNYDEIMERLVSAAGTMVVTFETNISKLIVDCMGFIEKQQVEIDELKAENKLLKDELSHDEVLNLINDSEQELVLQRILQREEESMPYYSRYHSGETMPYYNRYYSGKNIAKGDIENDNR